MKKCRILLLLLLSVFSVMVSGQNNGGLGVNNTGNPADSTAMLDVSSSSKGVLIPRLTTNERNAITNPAHGLLIFNITTGCFNFYRNGNWFEMCGNCIGPNPPAVSSNGPLCAGGTLNLYASAVPGATGYLWTGPGGFSSTAQNPVIAGATVAASGTYQCVATGSNCNSQAASVSVTVNAIPSALFTPSPASAGVGQSVTFTPQLSGATYSWTFQNGTPSTSTAQSPVVQWSTTGSFTISLTVTSNGCSASSSATFTVSTYQPGSITYNYTGASQTFVVPAGVVQLTIECWGAQGGTNPINVGGGTGGYGGYASGQLAVTPGQTLYVYVGGQGATTVTGGWNGGGNGCVNPGGGGASDVRNGGQALTDRIIVGAGGGGSSWETAWSGGWGVNNGAHNGGAGGGLTGQQGFSWQSQCQGGTGGTQSAGGITGGSFGQGGNGASSPGDTGGGGGGWYGGGGGGDCTGFNGSGGGGSSYIGGVTAGTTQQGIWTGNGKVVITY